MTGVQTCALPISERFVEFLKDLMKRRRERVFLVVDGHPSHKAKKVQAYVKSLGGKLELHFLPPYAPEFNPVEHLWGDLREKSFHNHVFDSRESLEAHLEQASPTSRSPPFAHEELRDCLDY